MYSQEMIELIRSVRDSCCCQEDEREIDRIQEMEELIEDLTTIKRRKRKTRKV